MNFSWLCLVIFALFAVVVSAGKCPKDFRSENGQCISQRTIRGDCPTGSTYKIAVNACVYGA